LAQTHNIKAFTLQALVHCKHGAQHS